MDKRRYSFVPGRGLVNRKSMQLRLDHLNGLGYETGRLSRTFLDPYEVQNNIESLIGSVEIPLGLVGPLTFLNNGIPEEVYGVAGTLEGALVASMNRGARAISLSGGFTAEVLHQKMIRAPVFRLPGNEEALRFCRWITDHYEQIKKEAEQHSNHAVLTETVCLPDREFVHVRFIYETGDAAGQNMTTTCTWHAVLWILDQYKAETGVTIGDFLLEGIGSSDKKVSRYLLDSGRGVKVTARCMLSEEVISRVLRTSSDKLCRFYDTSRRVSELDGMLGYNFNVANAVAAIFTATGQDLASIHESSLAELEFHQVPGGLSVTLTLFSLVIGSLGGGTQLPKQKQALQIMKCDGPGKVGRLASLIAGFAAGLEMSTLSAIVSGEFAKAHEMLGRNKEVDWLKRSELNGEFLVKMIQPHCGARITRVEIHDGEVENGIMINLCRRVNRKLIGFFPLDIHLETGEHVPLIIKSKPTDLEMVKGLHLASASINADLSDLLFLHWESLEYLHSHTKEPAIYEYLDEAGFSSVPKYYGRFSNTKREIHLLAMERLLSPQFHLMDSENQPHMWTREIICRCIDTITGIHGHFMERDPPGNQVKITSFEVMEAMPFYAKMVEILCGEYGTSYCRIRGIMHELGKEGEFPGVKKTLVHNDFNPRNIAIRKNLEPVIYDWELAVRNYPQRDVVELLSFVLPEQFNTDLLLSYLEYHYRVACPDHPDPDWEEWKQCALYCAKEFMLSRVVFYKTAEIVMKLKFVERVYNNCLRMIELLE